MLTVITKGFGNNSKLRPQSLLAVTEKLPCYPLPAQFKVVPGTSSPTQQYHKRRWLSWSPFTVQLQASLGVYAPRPLLTGLHWLWLGGLLVTVDMPLSEGRERTN